MAGSADGITVRMTVKATIDSKLQDANTAFDQMYSAGPATDATASVAQGFEAVSERGGAASHVHDEQADGEDEPGGQQAGLAPPVAQRRWEERDAVAELDLLDATINQDKS